VRSWAELVGLDDLEKAQGVFDYPDEHLVSATLGLLDMCGVFGDKPIFTEGEKLKKCAAHRPRGNRLNGPIVAPQSARPSYPRYSTRFHRRARSSVVNVGIGGLDTCSSVLSRR
jgi:hypothetical protein